MRRLLLLPILLVLSACGEPKPPSSPESAASYDTNGRFSAIVPKRAGRPNIIVIVIDTLRADCVAPEREGGGDMPFLSQLAREHITFPQAASSSSWTVPSLASMFTGLTPSNHGLIHEDVGVTRPGQLLTWAEVLRSSAGYQTAAFFGGLWPTLRYAMAQGFEESTDSFKLQLTEPVLGGWLSRRRPDTPFFLLLHTYEAHDPYGAANHPVNDPVPDEDDLQALLALGDTPDPADLVRRAVLDAGQRAALRNHATLRRHQPAMTRYLWSGLADRADPGLTDELERGYRGGVRWVDGLLERTFHQLRAQGLLENTLWIVTSDHGEAFGEHGMLQHGRQLYDELVRVPLVMGGPPPFDRPLESPASVGLVDLFPTVLDWLKLPMPADIEGRSFLPGLHQGNPGWPVCSEVSRSSLHTAGLSVAEVVSARSAAWKYIGTLDSTQGTLREEAYDLRSDPGETRNLARADGLVRDLPFDPDFCRAVERMRDRLWMRAVQADWGAKMMYGASQVDIQGARPASDCDSAER